MYSLTERRLSRLMPLLEQCVGALKKSGTYDTGHFESEVRSLLDTGYQEVKQLAYQLAKTKEFERVGAYYMEFGHGIGPAAEHERLLAKLYGVDSYDHSPETKEKREAYWAKH